MSRVLEYRDYYHMNSDEFQPGDVIHANVVLVIGYGNDAALYVDPSQLGTMESVDVACHGDKLSEKAARGLFPVAMHERIYRE